MTEGSFNENVVKQFKKNKLAKAGGYVILFLFFIAIFAPLLANNKPIFIYASLKQKYEKKYNNVKFLLQSMYVKSSKLKTEKDKKILKNALATLLNTTHSMKNLIVKKERANFTKLKNRIKTGFQNILLKTEKQNIKPARAAGINFTKRFHPKKIKLSKKFYMPAIAALSWLDIFFMSIFILTCFYRKIKKLVELTISKSKIFTRDAKAVLIISFILIPAILFSFIWGVSGSKVTDNFNYKAALKDLDSSDFYMMPLVPYGENENILEHSREAPTWLLSSKIKKQRKYWHWLGTDTNGRDVLARIIYGSRISMSVGFVAVSIYVLIGIILGSIAGYYRGWVDILISRFIEIMMTFPVFFLILIVLAMLKPSIMNIMVVIGVTGWTGIARLTRGEFLKLVGRDFVIAAKALGAKSGRIIFKHILPNALGPVLVAATFGVAGAILTESALSFLGFGVPQPTASWGDILNNGRNSIHATWWLTIFPGFMIFLTITAYNLVGEGIRDAMDPRLKK